jgi:predicted nuclease of restriction endonuclease-like (RecB) superfamily
LARLSADLTSRFGRGFSRQNLQQMRQFYLVFAPIENCQTASGNSADPRLIRRGVARSIDRDPATDLDGRFPLPWSHYVQLMSVDSSSARDFYASQALRGGWTVRQLQRQIGSQYYERTALSRKPGVLMRRERIAIGKDPVTPEEEFKDPYILEFLELKDEYSESQLEDALIHRLEAFLLELGDDFAFIGRQRRLRLDDVWYRVDVLLFHRRLRCLVVIDLKLDAFTHADAGQMHLYLNYAREHWTKPGENPPVGLILCAKKRQAVARYALEGLPNKILAAEYRTVLPTEERIAEELRLTREKLEERRQPRTSGRSPIRGGRRAPSPTCRRVV